LEEGSNEILHLVIACYGSETWILRKVDQKYRGRFDLWCSRRAEKIIWTSLVKILRNTVQGQGRKEPSASNKTQES
jgi:hypothetical protein